MLEPLYLCLYKRGLLQPQDSRKEGLQIDWREGSDARQRSRSKRTVTSQKRDAPFQHNEVGSWPWGASSGVQLCVGTCEAQKMDLQN